MELRIPFRWFLKPDVLDPYFKDFQPFFTSHGYALVLVDVRGTGASFGTWPYPWTEDSIEDAREIVDWIVAQPWSNGKVGGYGISYLGTTAELLTALEHPAVQGVIPMFIETTWVPVLEFILFVVILLVRPAGLLGGET